MKLKKIFKYYSHKTDDVIKSKMLPIKMLFIKEAAERGETVVVKNDLNVMITEILVVETGVCKGTTGYIKDKKNEIVAAEKILLQDNH